MSTRLRPLWARAVLLNSFPLADQMPGARVALCILSCRGLSSSIIAVRMMVLIE